MAGYSGTPLIRKLGIKPGFRCAAPNAPDHYVDLLGPLPDGAEFLDDGSDLDFVHLFFMDAAPFEEALPTWIPRIKPTGMIWISWPKKASKLQRDLNEDGIRGCALANGIVDVKVCAVDATWSGLKLMIRTKDRPRRR